VVNLLTAIQREIAFSARDSLLSVTTLSFDIAALEPPSGVSSTRALWEALI
jgi:hypothetical protein